MKDRDRYLKIVEWSEEDGCYVGSVPGWLGACCHGESEEQVYSQLCRIVDEWIAVYAEEGRPLPPATAERAYSGRLQLRTGGDLHKMLAIRALQTGESLNSFCVGILRRSVASPDKG